MNKEARIKILKIMISNIPQLELPDACCCIPAERDPNSLELIEDEFVDQAELNENLEEKVASAKDLIERKKLTPGIYIGSRKIAVGSLALPVGRHQFFVLVPKNPEAFKGKLQNLGGGNYGIVVGAYNEKDPKNKGLFGGKNRLIYRRNQKKDSNAVKEYLKEQAGKAVDPFWGTHLTRSDIRGRSTDEIIHDILAAGKHYRKTERKDNVHYPSPLATVLNKGQNSNTFVQSLADSVDLHKRRKNFPGYDSGTNLRFDESMFKKQEKEAGDNRRSHLPLRERSEVIARKGDKILIQDRDGYVEMPGGGTDGQSAKVAIRRETMEEAGAKLKNLKKIGVIESRWYPGIKDTDWGKELWDKYRGSKTHFFTADIAGNLRKPTSEEGDAWSGSRLMDAEKALDILKEKPRSYGMGKYRDMQEKLIGKVAK